MMQPVRAWALRVAVVVAAGPNVALAQQQPSPYSDEEDREIKALSSDEIAGLLSGEGMGMAKPAELNGVPGPRHVLELAAELRLSDAQLMRVEAAYERMREEAVRIGRLVVDLEKELDRAFVAGTPEPSEVKRLSLEVGKLGGHLRAVHLLAHIETLALLNRTQIHEYGRLRGYGHDHGTDSTEDPEAPIR